MLQPRLRGAPVVPSRGSDVNDIKFSELYARHHQALYRYCLSILRQEQDAQDALQNTMVKAHQTLAKEALDFELRPWLFRVAHNECISLLRRRRQTTALTDDLPAAATTEEQHAQREDLRQLAADLADLPERQRAALVLRELSGLSHDEIAQVLGVRSAIVKSTIFEARGALLEFRSGREMACDTVRAALSDGDKRVLRARRQRAHLRDCAGCRAFQADLVARPAQLAALAPPLPAAAALALLHHLMSGAGSGTGAAAIGAASSAAVGTGSAASSAAVGTGSAASSAAVGTGSAASSAAVGTGSAASAGLTATSAGSSVLGSVTAKLALGAGLAVLAAGGTAAVHSVLHPAHAAGSVAVRQAEHSAAVRAAQIRGAAAGGAEAGATAAGAAKDLSGGASTPSSVPRHNVGAVLAPGALKAPARTNSATNGASASSPGHQSSSTHGSTTRGPAPQGRSHRHVKGSRTSSTGASGRTGSSHGSSTQGSGSAGQHVHTVPPGSNASKPSHTSTQPTPPAPPVHGRPGTPSPLTP
jgi:RNA polymerase sigma factor (sigma-70 family)